MWFLFVILRFQAVKAGMFSLRKFIEIENLPQNSLKQWEELEVMIRGLGCVVGIQTEFNLTNINWLLLKNKILHLWGIIIYSEVRKTIVAIKNTCLAVSNNLTENVVHFRESHV